MIPDKIEKIIKHYNYDIQVGKIDGAYMAIIGINLPCRFYYEHNIVLNKLSVQGFLDTLDTYYNLDFDPKNEAMTIYYNNEGELWGDKIVGKDITLDDIIEDMQKEEARFYTMLKDLWKNSPRVNQNNKDLMITD